MSQEVSKWLANGFPKVSKMGPVTPTFFLARPSPMTWTWILLDHGCNSKRHNIATKWVLI